MSANSETLIKINLSSGVYILIAEVLRAERGDDERKIDQDLFDLVAAACVRLNAEPIQ